MNPFGHRTLGRSLGLIAVIGGLTLFMTATQSSFTLFIFNSCLLAAMGALALNLLMGTAGQVSIGNAAFLAVGAFVAVGLIDAGVPFPVDVLAAGVAAGIVGLVVGLPALRIRGLYLALATLSAQFIVVFLASRYESAKVGTGRFYIDRLFQSYGRLGEQIRWSWFLLGALTVVIFLFTFLMRSKSGRAWRIIRDHETIAPTLGISVTGYKLFAFIFSSVIIGMQGGLYAHLTGTVSYEDFTLLLAVSYITMIMIGGLDTIAGPIIGAAVIVSLPQVITNLTGGIFGSTQATIYSPRIAEIAYGVLIIIFITSSREGLVGLGSKLWGRLLVLVSKVRPRARLRPQAASAEAADAAF